jgi:hypothetical protein
VRVAAADYYGAPGLTFADIITAPGPGGIPEVHVFNGRATGNLESAFFAYASNYSSGVFVGGG